jgi:LCP family protein required for cell wall assembly
MSDTAHKEDETRSHHGAGSARDHQAMPTRRKRRPLRVALITLGSLLTLVIASVIGSYAYFNHVVGSIPRLSVDHLATANGSSTLDGQTFLIAAAPFGPTGKYSKADAPSQYSNLVMLLHTNADGKGGGAVTIPGNIRVKVPGAGTELLWNVFEKGSPSLLVQTVSQLTGVPIDHFARLDFSHISALLNVIGGVQVTVPATTEGYGVKFTKGVNNLTGVTAIYYARDEGLGVQDRLLRQENLVRTVITKIADEHLLTSPLTMVRVLNAVTGMMAVDSNFTNSDIESLIKQFGSLAADASTFVTMPTQTAGANQAVNPALDDQLWSAVKHDSIAAFAKKYPSTVTPQAAP